ncbi:MAG TPA: 4-hydroxy-3-methylbut-2-enyl diphosphate reductase [Hyphomicrobiaceae bacterium MAG_BT-2024]
MDDMRFASNVSRSGRAKIKLLLATPRGFCAGVDRAIQTVELALEKYGAPVFVRHEIVHNKYVIDCLKAKGAIFVEEIDEIVETDAPVIFSAHGVPKAVLENARLRNLFYIDATCPLVTKVHREAQIHYEKGRHILMIGHFGHPEVMGTVGQLPKGAITLIETIKDAEVFENRNNNELAYITQTTLSVQDTAAILAKLEERFGLIIGPNKSNICYATMNRQKAVSNIAKICDVILAVGAPNSSNSKRLVEVALLSGVSRATLVQRALDIPWGYLQDGMTVGITAGASAPEIIVQEIVDAIKTRFETTVKFITTANENVAFNLPYVLREDR